jgi:hypothetical protein
MRTKARIKSTRSSGGWAKLKCRSGPIQNTEISIFEIVWRHYVGYSVLNESYAAVDDAEQYEGIRFRIYSKSHFIDYMALESFASDDYPGPTQHYCVACEDHIVNVLSVEVPAVQRLR